MDTRLGKYRIDKIDCDRVTKFEVFITGIKNQYVIGNVQVDLFYDTPTVIFKYYQYFDNDIDPYTSLPDKFTRTDFAQSIYTINPNNWFQPIYLNISNSNLRDTLSYNKLNYTHRDGKIFVYNDEGAIDVPKSMSDSLGFEYAYVIDNTNEHVFWFCYDDSKTNNLLISHNLEDANEFTSIKLPNGIPYISHYDPSTHDLEIIVVGIDNKTITYQKYKLDDSGILLEHEFSNTLDIIVTQLTQVLDNDQGYGYRTYTTSYVKNDDNTYTFDIYKLVIDPMNEEVTYSKLTDNYYTISDDFDYINTKLLIYDNTTYVTSLVLNTDTNILKIVTGFLDNNSIVLSSNTDVENVENIILVPRFLYNNIIRYLLLVKTTDNYLHSYIFNQGYLNQFLYVNTLVLSNYNDIVLYTFNFNDNKIEYLRFDSSNSIYYLSQEKIFSFEMIYEDYSYNEDLNQGQYYIMFMNLYNEQIIKKDVKLIADKEIIFLDNNSNFLEFETLPDTITLKKFKIDLDNITKSVQLKIISIY